MQSSHEFPLYRKLSNNKVWYRIETPGQMTEVHQIGRHFQKTIIKARILPERILINDILNNEGERWLESSAIEFNLYLEKCK